MNDYSRGRAIDFPLDENFDLRRNGDGDTGDRVLSVGGDEDRHLTETGELEVGMKRIGIGGSTFETYIIVIDLDDLNVGHL